MLQCKTKKIYSKKKLGDLILFLRNGISNEQVDIYTDFSVTRIETIADGKIDYNKVGYVEKAPEDYKILQGDILVSNINSQKHIGKVAIKNDNKVLYHGMNLLLMRPNEDIDSKFLFYVLNFNKQYFERIASPAVNQSSINQTDMQKMEFIIPKDKNKQAEIADLLSTCDEVIEKTEETIEKYKQIKAGMMKDLFTRGLDENGKLRPTYAQSSDLYKYSEELDHYIPKEWDVKPLCEITDYISRGISPIYSDKETEYKILNQACIYTDQFKFENTKYITENCWNKIPSDRKVHNNDVFINSTGTGTLGRVNVYLDNNDNYTFDSHVTVIRFKKDQDAYFYCNYLNNKKQQEYVEINCVTGSTNQIELARTPFIKMPVINPDPGEQKLLSKVLVSIDNKINTEQKTLSKYKQIKQGLMKRLLTPPADAEIVEE